MGTVYRKTATKPLPPEAEIIERKGQRLAKWKDKRGRIRKAELTEGRDGSPRIVVVSRTYTAKYRDASRLVREVSTGCRDETAARRVLADLERRAELVKANVITAAENAVSDHQTVALSDHFGAYLVKLESDGTTDGHRKNVKRCLERVARECSLSHLGDVQREVFERWFNQQAKAGMSARTRNLYRSSWVAFCNWCVETDRMVANPLAKLKKADEASDRRRERRALAEDELTRVLHVACHRPLAEYGRETVKLQRKTAKGRRTWKKRPLTIETLADATERARHALRDNPKFLQQLVSTGRERALIYKTLVLTGLRKGELTSLTIGQVDLSAPVPFVDLLAADEKNREGSHIPLRADLAEDLRVWLGDKLHRMRTETMRNGEPIPAKLPANAPLFRVPRDLYKILHRDLKAAGIPIVDERGRSVDVHALRHSFGTLLSKAGVMPRTAQAAMRHSSIDLTMNVYTDPRLLDVNGALDALPALPIDQGDGSKREAATGTDGASREFAPGFAPKTDKPSKSGSIVDKAARLDENEADDNANVVSLSAVKRKQPLPTADNGCLKERAKGLEPSTNSLGSCNDRVLSEKDKGLAPTGTPVCTRVCTSEPEKEHDAALRSIVDRLRAELPGDQLARLAAMLQTVAQAAE